MRATLRITWLLLSLSSLSPGIYSESSTVTPVIDTSTNLTSITVLTSTIQTETIAKEETSTAGGADSGTKAKTAAQPTEPTATTKSAEEITPTATKPTVTASTTAFVTTEPEISTASITPEIKDPAAPTDAPSSDLSTSTPKITLPASTTADKSIQSTTATTNMVTDPGTSKSTSEKSGSDAAKTNPTTLTPALSSAQTPTDASTTPAAGPADSSNGTKQSATTTSGSTLPLDQGLGASSGPTNTTSSQALAGPTTAVPDTKTGTAGLPTTTSITKPPPPPLKSFSYHLNNEVEKENIHFKEVCNMLMKNWESGSCNMTYWKDNNNKIHFESVEITGKVKNSSVAQYYADITKEPTDNKTLIAILASCGALLIMIVILAVCASHHRKPYNENQQHLTEELNTVENGYHDNPTLEVMEVQPEMQEKKVALNGEFNDNWIVPMDNLIKEDIPDEEDTHL